MRFWCTSDLPMSLGQFPHKFVFLEGIVFCLNYKKLLNCHQRICIYSFLLQTYFMAIFLIVPFFSLPCGSSHTGQNKSLNISTRTYSINLPSSRCRYELQVRSTIASFCGESSLWSDWSPSAFWGSNRESNGTGKTRGKQSHICLFIVIVLHNHVKRIMMLSLKHEFKYNLYS